MHKDFLDVFARVMDKSLLLNEKKYAAGIYSSHDCDRQDWHQDLKNPPQCRQRLSPRDGKKKRKWDDEREIPGLLVLGDQPQELHVVMGSHEVIEVRTILLMHVLNFLGSLC
jgi:hypothetical protein